MSELIKSQVKGYNRANGSYVAPHRRKGDKGSKASGGTVHPATNDSGDKVYIKTPTTPTGRDTWQDPNTVATFIPSGDVPMAINGIPLRSWKDHPKTSEGWDYEDGINHSLHEPAFVLPPGKSAGAGVIIEEPDGRVWLIHPTNQFGGYQSSYPKGTIEPELSMQGNALKEAFEESGLKVEITGFIGDFERTTSMARMYKARRVSGSPTDAGWESQAVSLVPKAELYEHLNMWPDHAIAERIGAGPAPKKK